MRAFSQIVSRVTGGRGRTSGTTGTTGTARPGRTTGSPLTGRPARTGSAKDRAAGRGVRSLLNRFR